MSRRQPRQKSLSAGEFLSGLASAAQANPLPAAFLGIGALWILGRDIVAPPESRTNAIAETATKRPTKRPRTHTTRQTIAESARAAERGFGSLWDERPLVVGAIALAAGAGLAALFPTTIVEKNLIGSQAERLAAQTKSFIAEKAAQARG